MPNFSRFIEWLVNLFTQSEQFLSGVNNFLGILAVGIAVLSIVRGWWKRIWYFLRDLISFFRSNRLATGFPFDIIESRTDLMERLYPQVLNQVLADYDIPCMERPINAAAFEKLRVHQRLILAGISKRGKTRIALEMADDLLSEGFTILLLKPYAWLDAPLLVPQNLFNRKILIFIDAIENYIDLQPSVTENNTRFRSTSFEIRLKRTIEQFELFSGDPENVWLIGTAKIDSERWKSSGFDEHSLIWNSIYVVKIPSLSNEETALFINRLAVQTNIDISSSIVDAISSKNDGSFYTLVTAFREWHGSNISKITINQVHNFDGKLAQLWERKYHQHTTKMPSTKYIYAALDILLLADLPGDITLVNYLSVGLQNKLFIPFITFTFGPFTKISAHLPRLMLWLRLIGILITLIISAPIWLLFLPWTRKSIRSVK